MEDRGTPAAAGAFFMFTAITCKKKQQQLLGFRILLLELSYSRKTKNDFL